MDAFKNKPVAQEVLNYINSETQLGLTSDSIKNLTEDQLNRILARAKTD
jgi:hypothetical protein